MSELRADPISRCWTIIAKERGKRPHDFKIEREVRQGGSRVCPFCEGNEGMTPPEVLALGRNTDLRDSPGWSVRVVPNKFPAVSPNEEGSPVAMDGLLRHMPGVGAHEVLIESPDHDATWGSYSDGQLEDIFRAVLLRMKELRKDGRFKYFQFFKNSGRIAGASLEHAHSQIIVTPIIPVAVRDELNTAHEYYETTGECLFCAIIRKERQEGTRVVDQNSSFVAFCPYASRFPYEIQIFPILHSHDFEALYDDPSGLARLSKLLKGVMAKLEDAFEFLPYNLLLHTAPWEPGYGKDYHWHIEILPRLTIIAGFELGTGFYINPTAPELAAEELRYDLVSAVRSREEL